MTHRDFGAVQTALSAGHHARRSLPGIKARTNAEAAAKATLMQSIAGVIENLESIKRWEEIRLQRRAERREQKQP